MAYRSNGGGGPLRDSRDLYERRAPSRGPPVREREREQVVDDAIDVRIRSHSRSRDRDRDRDRDREARVPGFLRDDARRAGPGPLVLRQREVEFIERERERPRRRSPSPPHRRPPRRDDDVRVRMVERERVRSPRPITPPAIRERVRMVERRGRSPSPVEREREHIRITEKERERFPTPSPSPSPPAPSQVIRGPVIEREVITHYRDIAHGMVPAPRPPSAPPPRRRSKERDTEIDIYTSRNSTEVDIHKSSSHSRTRERSRSRDRPAPPRVYNNELVTRSDRHRLGVDMEPHSGRRPRAHSAAPPAHDYDDEADYITGRINERGRMGEAWGGATQDWTIIDVPPGTERVRMDGVGGASAEVSWQRYSGMRRAKFLPERDAAPSVSSASLSERETRLSVQMHDKDGRGDRERDIEVSKVADRRLSVREPDPPAPALRRSDLWTEVTKDLIVREAIEELGHEYEETDKYFYIMEYLHYEDVLELVRISDSIRRSRKDRVRELQWERDVRADFDGDRRPRRRGHGHAHSVDRFEDELVYERERDVVYERAAPVRGYHR